MAFLCLVKMDNSEFLKAIMTAAQRILDEAISRGEDKNNWHFLILLPTSIMNNSDAVNDIAVVVATLGLDVRTDMSQSDEDVFVYLEHNTEYAFVFGG